MSGSLTRLTAPLKALRAWQPFNALATGLVRRVLRGTGLPGEWAVAHLHRVGPVEAALPNGRTLRLWSRGDDWVSNQVFWRGWAGYEPETTPLFFHLATRARVTLDVGAYVGFFALLAGHANAAAAVFAFEPLPGPYERLQRNVAANGLANVTCLAAAAGAGDGTAELFHVAGAMPTSSSLSLEFMRPAGELQRLAVPVVALDRFVSENGLARVDLVKVDTESTEPDVLAGMHETLERDHPAIVCEVLQGRGAERRLTELLAGLGYHFFLLTPEGPVRKDAVEGHPSCLNYLFSTEQSVSGRGA